MLDDKNIISTTKKEKIYDLGIQRLKSDIEGINLQIQSLELELELEDTTIDKEKKLLN